MLRWDLRRGRRCAIRVMLWRQLFAALSSSTLMCLLRLAVRDVAPSMARSFRESACPESSPPAACRNAYGVLLSAMPYPVGERASE